MDHIKNMSTFDLGLWTEIGKFWYYNDFEHLLHPLDEIEDHGSMVWSSLFRSLIVMLMQKVGSNVHDPDMPEPFMETSLLKNIYATLETVAKQTNNPNLEKTWSDFIEMSKRSDIMKSMKPLPMTTPSSNVIFFSQ